MAEIMSAEQVAEIREKASYAAPGPWSVPGYGSMSSYAAVNGPSFEFTCGNCGAGIRTNQVPLADPGDADFIAVSRTGIPALCDTVEALRAENERLRAALKSALDCVIQNKSEAWRMLRAALATPKELSNGR